VRKNRRGTRLGRLGVTGDEIWRGKQRWRVDGSPGVRCASSKERELCDTTHLGKKKGCQKANVQHRKKKPSSNPFRQRLFRRGRNQRFFTKSNTTSGLLRKCGKKKEGTDPCGSDPHACGTSNAGGQYGNETKVHGISCNSAKGLKRPRKTK